MAYVEGNPLGDIDPEELRGTLIQPGPPNPIRPPRNQFNPTGPRERPWFRPPPVDLCAQWVCTTCKKSIPKTCTPDKPDGLRCKTTFVGGNERFVFDPSNSGSSCYCVRKFDIGPRLPRVR